MSDPYRYKDHNDELEKALRHEVAFHKGQADVAIKFYMWTLIAMVVLLGIIGFIHDQQFEQLLECRKAIRQAEHD